jgi:hypothetical protein
MIRYFDISVQRSRLVSFVPTPRHIQDLVASSTTRIPERCNSRCGGNWNRTSPETRDLDLASGAVLQEQP